MTKGISVLLPAVRGFYLILQIEKNWKTAEIHGQSTTYVALETTEIYDVIIGPAKIGAVRDIYLLYAEVAAFVR